MTTKNQIEIATWQRWAIGIFSTIMLALFLDFGHSGSQIKKVQAGHTVKIEDINSDVHRIEDKFTRVEDKIDALELQMNEIKLILINQKK
jgi:hypothetical protein